MLKKLFPRLANNTIPLLVIVLNILIIIYPSPVTRAAKSGLLLWFNTIIPSLLPFMIVINLLHALGATIFIGNVLAPFMDKIFNTGGRSGFVMITSLFSGCPMAAKTVSMLYESKEISSIDSQRLLSFVNISSPIFIIASVGESMYNNASIGYFLLFIQYLSSLINGYIFRFYKYNSKTTMVHIKKNASRSKDISYILSQSIMSSLETLAIIGGFIIFFRVISEIIQLTGLITMSYSYIKNIMSIDEKTYEALIIGILEITSGSKMMSQLPVSSANLGFLNFILAFSGVSIYLQSLSFVNNTKINKRVFLISKLTQAFIALCLSLILYKFIDFSKNNSFFLFFY